MTSTRSAGDIAVKSRWRFFLSIQFFAAHRKAAERTEHGDTGFHRKVHGQQPGHHDVAGDQSIRRRQRNRPGHRRRAERRFEYGRHHRTGRGDGHEKDRENIAHAYSQRSLRRRAGAAQTLRRQARHSSLAQGLSRRRRLSVRRQRPDFFRRRRTPRAAHARPRVRSLLFLRRQRSRCCSAATIFSATALP